MAEKDDDAQGQGAGTQDGDEGQAAGTDADKTEDINLDEVLKHPAVKKAYDERVDSESDRKVTKLKLRLEREAKEREAAAAEKAKQEAKEAKLLEDGKLEELAAAKAEEAAEARAKLGEYEKRDKVTKLLDVKAITDTDFRALFLDQTCDLEVLGERIDAFKEQFAQAVSKAVDERLQTAPPPKSGEKPEGAPKSLQEALRLAEQEALKTGDWTEHSQIGGQILDKQTAVAP